MKNLWLIASISVVLVAFSWVNTVLGLDKFSGVFKQGGYISGQVEPNSKIYLLDKEVKIGLDGRFFAGLHRYFPAEGELRIVGKNGKEDKQTFIVEPRIYKTQHVKGVAKKHVNPDPKQVARSKREGTAIRNARASFSEYPYVFESFKNPLVKVPLSGVYGSRRTFNGEERSWHKGLDMAAVKGTPVYAPTAGVVTLALADSFFNGNIIVLDHGYGLFSIYAHLSSMSVTAGDKIEQGQLLGKVGKTGRATGSHLHWGVYWHNTALDPQLFLTNTKK